jgi:hypothetical protein
VADPGHGKEASVSRTDRFMVRHQQLMPLPDNLRLVDRRCTAPSIAQWIRAWLTNDRLMRSRMSIFGQRHVLNTFRRTGSRWSAYKGLFGSSEP